MPKTIEEKIAKVKEQLDALEQEILHKDREGMQLMRKEIELEDQLMAVLAEMIVEERGRVETAKVSGKRKEKGLLNRISGLETKKKQYEQKKEMLKKVKEKTVQIRREMDNLHKKIQRETKELYQIEEFKKADAAEKYRKVDAAEKNLERVLAGKKPVKVKPRPKKPKMAKPKPVKKKPAPKPKKPAPKPKPKKVIQKPKKAVPPKPKPEKVSPPKPREKMEGLPRFLEGPKPKETVERAEEIIPRPVKKPEEKPEKPLPEEKPIIPGPLAEAKKEKIEPVKPLEEETIGPPKPKEPEAKEGVAGKRDEMIAKLEKRLAKKEPLAPKPSLEKPEKKPVEGPWKKEIKAVEKTELKEFKGISLYLSYPAWPEMKEKPFNAVLAVSEGLFSFMLTEDSEGKSLKDHINARVAEIKGMPDSRVIDRKETKDHIFLSYTHSREGNELQTKSIFIFYNGRIYTLAFTAPKERFGKINDIFWKTAKSVKFF